MPIRYPYPFSVVPRRQPCFKIVRQQQSGSGHLQWLKDFVLEELFKRAPVELLNDVRPDRRASV